MISATGRISLIALTVCPADHYRRVRCAKAEATVERGSPNSASPARDWCRETRHVGDRGTPSPSSHHSRCSRHRWRARPCRPWTEPTRRTQICGLFWVQVNVVCSLATESCLRDDRSERPSWVDLGRAPALGQRQGCADMLHSSGPWRRDGDHNAAARASQGHIRYGDLGGWNSTKDTSHGAESDRPLAA
jgi:hypothetical protein